MRGKGEGPGLDLDPGTIREAFGEVREHSVSGGIVSPSWISSNPARGEWTWGHFRPHGSHTLQYGTKMAKRMELGRKQAIGAKGTIGLDVAWRQRSHRPTETM